MKYVWTITAFNEAGPDCAYTTKKAAIEQVKKDYPHRNLKFKQNGKYSVTVYDELILGEWLVMLNKLSVIHNRKS